MSLSLESNSPSNRDDMITWYEEKNDKGEVVATYPCAQFVINSNQHFFCFGLDFNDNGGLTSIGAGIEHIKYTPIGKLNEQSVIFSHQIVNSLRLEDWDMGRYPNPEIVIAEWKPGYDEQGNKM